MQSENRFYDEVHLVPKKTKPVTMVGSHQQYETTLLTGQIRGVFCCFQPLHVGTGLVVPPAQVGIKSEAPLVKSFHQIEGRLTVPGSSLKGPIRSFVEMITHACVSKTKSKLDKETYGECRYNSRWQQGEICVVCRMFGAMGYQGHIMFGDAPMIIGETAVHHIPAQHQAQGGVARRHYAHDLQDERHPTWPLEVALPESCFALHIRYDNLSPAELGLLLMALGQGEQAICLKIGAGKSSGLGGIQFDDLQVEQVIPANLYQAYDSQPAWQLVQVDDCLLQASTLIRKDKALPQLQDALGC